MNKVHEITPEDWAQLMLEIEQALGQEKRQMIEHRISVLEAMCLQYTLEAEEDLVEDYLGG